MANKDDVDGGDIVVEVLSPVAADDYVAQALEAVGLDEVIRSLRKIHTAQEIKKSLSKLQHKEPVNELLHVRRVALDFYAKEHSLTTSSLMVEIEGLRGRTDAHGAEREKLRKAKEVVSKDLNLRIGAKTLADQWIAGSKGKDPRTYIKSVKPLRV